MWKFNEGQQGKEVKEKVRKWTGGMETRRNCIKFMKSSSQKNVGDKGDKITPES